MTNRPVFVPIKETGGDQLVHDVEISFKWVPGLAPSQKRKNIHALHAEANKAGIHNILEISTKSEHDLGVRLSAFNLKIEMGGTLRIPLESAFQGSKIFEHGGPYVDLYGKEGGYIKNDSRLKTSGRIKQFYFDGKEWELEPKTAFYDWLYINAVHRRLELHSDLLKYEGFTDIEFNPKKSINCQARSCALYVSLVARGIIDRALIDSNFFLDILKKDSAYHSYPSANNQLRFL